MREFSYCDVHRVKSNTLKERINEVNLMEKRLQMSKSIDLLIFISYFAKEDDCEYNIYIHTYFKCYISTYYKYIMYSLVLTLFVIIPLLLLINIVLTTKKRRYQTKTYIL